MLWISLGGFGKLRLVIRFGTDKSKSLMFQKQYSKYNNSSSRNKNLILVITSDLQILMANIYFWILLKRIWGKEVTRSGDSNATMIASTKMGNLSKQPPTDLSPDSPPPSHQPYGFNGEEPHFTSTTLPPLLHVLHHAHCCCSHPPQLQH